MKLKYLFSYNAKLANPLHVGASRHGTRDILQIEGGEIWGENIRGKVLPIGAEFQLTDSDGNYHVDVRTVFETDDNALIYVYYHGVSAYDEASSKKLSDLGYTDFADTYFVTMPRFETGHENYRWLNNVVCVAEGRISKPWTVEYRVYQCIPTTDALAN